MQVIREPRHIPAHRIARPDDDPLVDGEACDASLRAAFPASHLSSACSAPLNIVRRE
jgi:hypothetical protein